MAIRTLVFAAVVIAVGTPAGAIAPVVVYIDQETGHFWLGLDDTSIGDPEKGSPLPTLGIGPVNSRHYEVDVDQCHRSIWFSLHYDPAEVGAAAGENSVAAGYSFVVGIHNESLGFSASRNVSAPGDSFPLGAVPTAGRYEVDVAMRFGVDVNWTFTLRGLDILRFSSWEWEPACARVRITEVEANPNGTDAGNEWVELHNEEFYEVDVSGWTITALHGVQATLALPSGTLIPAEGFIVVTFTEGQFLDNVDEVVLLTNAWGLDVDETPASSDSANDARTIQVTQGADGSDVWTFMLESPGAPNPSP